jgi:hypothetical protein
MSLAFGIVYQPSMKHDVAWHDMVLLARKLQLECVFVINYEHHYGQPIVLNVDVLVLMWSK